MSYSAKLTTVVCVWLVLLWGYPALAAESRPEEIYASALPATITLEVENAAGQHFIGSAFLAVRDGLAVTAWHVVHDARRIEARFADNQRVPVVGWVDKDEEHDLALIALARGGAPKLAVCSAPPRVGSRIYTIGAPKGLDFSLSEGLVSQIRMVDGVEFYQISSPISPGDSGGPVLNERGEVIGIMSWRKANAENLGFAIPGSDLLRLNASRAPTPWAQATIASRPASPAQNGETFTRAPAPAVGDGFGAFQKLLAERAGKPVTVIVQEGGKENRFKFIAPAGVPQEHPSGQ